MTELYKIINGIEKVIQALLSNLNGEELSDHRQLFSISKKEGSVIGICTPYGLWKTC